MNKSDKISMFVRNPRRIISLYHFIGENINKQIGELLGPPSGTAVMKEDWDNLLILDACRYDMFERINFLEGTLDRRQSLASFSGGFLAKNFSGRTFHDTVYVTANPYVHELEDGCFHAVLNVIETDWDERVGTVPPEAMADALRDAHRKFPEKRIIGHFMQPHAPFIGPKGQKIPQGIVAPEGPSGRKSESSSPPDVWRQLQFRLNDIDRTEVLEAYDENLEIVLEEVEPLLEDLDGKTVVTSDHGNLVGEWIGPFPARGYGHPPTTYTDNLIQVPWFVTTHGDRRMITATEPVEWEGMDSELAKERLADLGYMLTSESDYYSLIKTAKYSVSIL